MSRAVALILTILGVLWARSIDTTAPASSAGTALVVGFMLIGAWITGNLVRRFRLPQITGHLAFGLVMGPYLGNVVTASMAGQLQFITGIATTLIALIAGLTLNVERLGTRLLPIAQTTAVAVLLPITGLLVLGWLAWPWLGIAPEATGLTRLAMVVLFAIVAVSFSPTMTAAVMADVGDNSRLSEIVLTIVVLADLMMVVLFAAAMQGARAVFSTGDFSPASFLVHVLWETGGAVAFGVLVGALFVLYLRYIGREVPLVLVGLCTLLSQVAAAEQFEPLLAAVAAGFVIEHVAVNQGGALRIAVREGAPPVLVLFFVSVGVSLRLDAIATMGLLAIALVAVRLVLVWAGVGAGLRLSGLDEPTRDFAWTGLISQAGIPLSFVSVVAAEFPGWGSQLQLLLVGAIAINELIGPVAFRHALVRAGDEGATTPRPMVVVSNREPYLHQRGPHGEITVNAATGGVAVALDALMRERGGVWIAHGAGSADREVVDANDKVRVPPDVPSYDLRRLWIDDQTFAAYYGGFSNEGLWPLCHVVDVRPRFRTEDWQAYQTVNAEFARVVHHELGDSDAPVFIQDYHLALVAPELRRLRPDARTAIFWHIPWPYPDRLRICPWRREILMGLLANDLIAFQLERDRRNFLYAVGEELEFEIDEDASRVYVGGHHATVVSVPIGVDYDRIQTFISDPALPVEQARLRTHFDLRADIIGLGVDRLDYTKGIPERLAALDALVTARPELRGRLTFVQIGVPSRSTLESYAAVENEIGRLVEDLNARHAVPGGAPLVELSTSALSAFSLTALYRIADFCVVSSLHDGMNLVAKEFVAARDDNGGVLVLSALAGAAQELQEAVIINPYDVDGFAGALGHAIDMPAEERARRMRAMRKIVAGRNVFSWASDILEGLESLWTKPLLYSVRGWEDTGI